jgi:hypothetical protein
MCPSGFVGALTRRFCRPFRLMRMKPALVMLSGTLLLASLPLAAASIGDALPPGPLPIKTSGYPPPIASFLCEPNGNGLNNTACNLISDLICFPTGPGGLLPCGPIYPGGIGIAVGCGPLHLPINDPPYPPVIISGPIPYFGPYSGVGVLCNFP